MNWLNPVSEWNGYRAVVSDNYSAHETSGHREHHGVDLMFKRRGGVIEQQFAVGSPNGSLMFFMPNNVLMLAAEDGTLWSSSQSPKGWQCVVSHTGNPWATYYQHMTTLLVPLVAQGKGGVRIERGQPLGIIGGTPPKGLKHSHFEMWRDGGADAHVDPEREGIASWPSMNVSESKFAGALQQLGGAAAALGVGLVAGHLAGKKPAGT